jgi:cytoskeletal protein CcmA (bactofilin family)
MATSGWAAMKIRRQVSKAQVPVPAVAPPATNGSDGRGRAVVLGPHDRLIGQLFIEGDLRVTGTVEGALEATGNIEIDGGGSVSGPVTAYNRLVVGSAGSLNGDVRVSRLVIADGATFSGNVSMGKQQPVVEPKPVEVVPEPVVPIEIAAPAATRTKTLDTKKKRR